MMRRRLRPGAASSSALAVAAIVAVAALVMAARAQAGRPRKVVMPTSSLPPVVDVSFARDSYATAHRGARPGVAVWDLADDKAAEPRRFVAVAALPEGPARVALSSDGARLAAAAREGGLPIVVVNARTGATVARVNGPKARLAALAWSPDGASLAAFGEDPGGPPAGAKPHPDKVVSYSSSGRVQLWSARDWKSPRLVLEGPAEAAAALAFAPDGKRLAALFAGGTCAVWSLETGKLEKQVALTGRVGATAALAYSPDGKRLAAALGGADGNGSLIELLDAATLQPGGKVAELPPLAAQLAFAADGARLALTTFEAVTVVDVSAARVVTALDYAMATGKDPRGAAFVARGLLVVGGEQRLWQLWNLDGPGGRPQPLAGLQRK
jgi:hypothetical protein